MELTWNLEKSTLMSRCLDRDSVEFALGSTARKTDRSNNKSSISQAKVMGKKRCIGLSNEYHWAMEQAYLDNS